MKLVTKTIVLKTAANTLHKGFKVGTFCSLRVHDNTGSGDVVDTRIDSS